MDIPHADGDPPATGPFWRYKLEGGVRTAWVRCGAGHLGSLEEHSIAPDGTVSPSLECPWEKCTWHVNARLIDWRP